MYEDLSVRSQSKTEKENLFLMNSETELKHFDPVVNSLSQNDEPFGWFYKNPDFLFSLIGEEISSDIVYDITRVLIAEYDHRKGSRYLSLKYDLKRQKAEYIYLAASRIIWSRKDYIKYLTMSFDSKTDLYYTLYSHSSSCEKCKQMHGKVYKISEAVFGVNFPPFCPHGCSKALLVVI